jgi:hypothetical protein
VESNKDALRRLGEQARDDIAKLPAWMRNPPREPVIWKERAGKEGHGNESERDRKSGR